MKKCFMCQEEKPIEEFAWKNKEKGWRQSHCRSCHRSIGDNIILTTSKNILIKLRETVKFIKKNFIIGCLLNVVLIVAIQILEF